MPNLVGLRSVVLIGAVALLAFPFAAKADAEWTRQGSVVRLTNSGDRVGLGTESGNHRLTIGGGPTWTSAGWSGALQLFNVGAIGWNANNAGNAFGIGHTDGGLYFFRTASEPGNVSTPATYDLHINNAGHVGIGTEDPRHRLSVGGGPQWTSAGWGGALDLLNAGAIGWRPNAAGNAFGIGHTDGGLYFFRTTSDLATTGAPATYDLRIDDSGLVSVKVVRITGGADIAEHFDVRETNGNALPERQPGLVVSIDPENPGRLVVSNDAYDRRVAGIISGAGGVTPGMLIGQTGAAADGEYPIALSGRAYCWADATDGPIAPGDLLTTSDTPGHAMKVVDHARAQGAIIGKAMSSLENGRGMVLALVSLQ